MMNMGFGSLVVKEKMPNRAAGMFVGTRGLSWTRAGSSPCVFQGPRDKSRPLYRGQSVRPPDVVVFIVLGSKFP